MDIKPLNDGWVHHWKWENDEWEYAAGGLDVLADILSKKQCSFDIVAPLVYRLAEEIENWEQEVPVKSIPYGVYMRMGHFALVVGAVDIAEDMSRVACDATGGTLECLTLARVLVTKGQTNEANDIVTVLEGSKSASRWTGQIKAFRESLQNGVRSN
ncbi:MAG: hypothetical protein JKY01_04155 [Pseudomonadales bacterium]|nr:hypothetical protein [Pseudomonadales bacterium]